MAANEGLWFLPVVLSVDSVKITYQTPIVRYVDGNRIEYSEVVEIFVRTSEEIPTRALSVALFIGQEPVVDFERLGENLYRFFAYDPGKLQEGAPILIGWADLEGARVDTQITFALKGQGVA